MLRKIQDHIILQGQFKPLLVRVKKNSERIEGSSVLVLVCTVCVFFNLSGIVDIENVQVTVTFLANVFFFFFTKNCQLELFDKITQTEQFFDGLLFLYKVYMLP